MFCKKGVLRNFAKSTGKHLCQRLFFNKIAVMNQGFLTEHGNLKINMAKLKRQVKFLSFLAYTHFLLTLGNSKLSIIVRERLYLTKIPPMWQSCSETVNTVARNFRNFWRNSQWCDIFQKGTPPHIFFWKIYITFSGVVVNWLSLTAKFNSTKSDVMIRFKLWSQHVGSWWFWEVPVMLQAWNKS